jgi:ornithine cyclodeaminase
MDGATGVPLVSMDAAELTARRTSAASALAGDYLSRKNATKLLIVGSGRLAAYLGFAHGSLRSLQEIKIWARSPVKAQRIVEIYREAGYITSFAADLEEAARWADIISCATMSTQPLILGKWIQKGTHIDLIGGFKPTMRETDDEVITRASVFADTKEGVLAEAGDLLIPIENGVFTPEGIVAELSQLTSMHHPGRQSEDEVTVFKSVGASLEDLAAAIRCYENWLMTAGSSISPKNY